MIVVQVSDPYLRRAVCRAAHPEEDVVLEARQAADALDLGFPRLVVRLRDDGRPAPARGIGVLELDDTMLRRWEIERRLVELPPTRLDHLTGRLALLMDRTSGERSRVDRTLADLTKATGAQLPHPLRTFARRFSSFRRTTRACMRWLMRVARVEGLSRRSSGGGICHRLTATSVGSG